MPPRRRGWRCTASGTDGTAWGWLGGTRADVVPAGGEHGPAGPSADGVHVPADAKLEPPPGTQLAVGTPGEGVEGFRSSHRQALSTYRIARGTTQPVTTFADVVLLALTLQDPTLAREFVRCELGPLAGDDARSQLLRETLRAYFDAGQNAAAAAAALGVHERTVTYRLRSIEQHAARRQQEQEPGERDRRARADGREDAPQPGDHGRWRRCWWPTRRSGRGRRGSRAASSQPAGGIHRGVEAHEDMISPVWE